MTTHLRLQTGQTYAGKSFGADRSAVGEVVFATGMVGYPEALTDPSFAGNILVMTYPLVGNYGVPAPQTWESQRIWVSGLIVAQYIDTPSHYTSQKTLADWLIEQNVPALEIADTRVLTQLLREHGTLVGAIEKPEEDLQLTDPNTCNLVAEVSPTTVQEYGQGKKTLVLLDCGAKENIVRELVKRQVKVIRVPWNYDFLAAGIECDGVVISNGPGDPKQVTDSINLVKKIIKAQLPILGICLGNQLLALASGGDTYKLPYGHRSQNQPAVLVGTQRCYLTTQNHGYAVNVIPDGFREWFKNGNDGSNEGIIHQTQPWMSVQFHPESRPGPLDTGFVFDQFMERLD